MVKLPSRSADAPLPGTPTTATVAPMTGSPVVSLTVPVTVTVWAWATVVKSKTSSEAMLASLSDLMTFMLLLMIKIWFVVKSFGAYAGVIVAHA